MFLIITYPQTIFHRQKTWYTYFYGITVLALSVTACAGAPEKARTLKVAVAVSLYDPTRENGIQESPQTFLNPEIKINFPLNMARACGGHFKSSNCTLNRRYPRHAAHRKIL